MIEVYYGETTAAISVLWCLGRGIWALRRKRVDWKRELQLLLVYICVIVVVRFTFFPFFPVDGKIQPLLFNAALLWPPRTNVIPFIKLLDYPETRDILINVIGNTTMFMPIGVIFPIVYKKLDTPAKVILAGVGFTLCIEILQLPFFDRVTDVDDLILNSVGFVLGYLLYRLFRGLFARKKDTTLLSAQQEDSPVRKRQEPLTVECLKYAESVLPESMVFAGGDRERMVPISFAVYLIIDRDRKILIDAGCDTMPGFVMQNFISPVEALAKRGVKPEQITDVVITHGHHDHIEAVKHFSNAVICITSAAYQEATQYLAENHRICCFTDTYALTPHIRLLEWGGHAPGSAIVEIQDGDITHVFAGDECYTDACITRKIPTGAYYDLEKSRAFIEKYSDPQYCVHTCHDPSLQTKKILELGEKSRISRF